MDSSRRRLLYHLNSRWIYGKIVREAPPLRAPTLTWRFCQPLLHAAVFLVQMAAVSLLARKYNSYYAQRPGRQLRIGRSMCAVLTRYAVLTTMITNAVRAPSCH